VSSTTPADIIVGVDTHKDIRVAVTISASGVYLATTTVKADTKGYGALESWTRSMGVVQAFGIEGTGSYGAGLSRFLRERGHTVLEVNRPNRQLRHQKVKTTPSMPRTPPAPSWPVRSSVSPRPARAQPR
jgi:transposase